MKWKRSINDFESIIRLKQYIHSLIHPGFWIIWIWSDGRGILTVYFGAFQPFRKRVGIRTSVNFDSFDIGTRTIPAAYFDAV